MSASKRITKEGRLAGAIMDFCLAAHSEGDLATLRDIGVVHGVLQTILSTSAHHHLLLHLDWFPIESLSIPVLMRMLSFLQQAGAAQDVQDRLLAAGAPKTMMHRWFGWNDQTWSQRCRALSVDVHIGRPNKPNRDQQAVIDEALQSDRVAAALGRVRQGVDACLSEANGWLLLSHETALPIRVLVQSDEVHKWFASKQLPVRREHVSDVNMSLCLHKIDPARAMEISKEGVLAKAIMEFCIQARQESDMAVLLDMGIDHQIMETILSTSAHHHLLLHLDWFPIESLSIPVLMRMLSFLQQAGAAQDVQDRLLAAGAPKTMMHRWFGWNDQTWSQRCRALSVDVHIGRPNKPNRDQQADIEEAWERLMAGGVVEPAHPDVMVRAAAWIRVSEEVGLPIRIIIQADPIDLPIECTYLQFQDDVSEMPCRGQRFDAGKSAPPGSTAWLCHAAVGQG